MNKQSTWIMNDLHPYSLMDILSSIISVMLYSQCCFCTLVLLPTELYVTSTKKQKMAISRSIVEAIRSMEPAGRFLDKSPATGLWSDIGDRKAVEKTSQALRDGAATLRKQLSEDLGDPDFLSAVFENDGNCTSVTASISSGSSSSASSLEVVKKQQQQQHLTPPVRPMKSRMARRGRMKNVPLSSFADVQKPAKKVTRQPDVDFSSKSSSSSSRPPIVRPSNARSTSSADIHLNLQPPKRSSRTVSASIKRSDVHPHYPMDDPFEEAELPDDLVVSPWATQRPSSRNSHHPQQQPPPPFFPMSPVAPRSTHPSHGAPHIFSCFQEPTTKQPSKAPVSPPSNHHSWSESNFRDSPFDWRQSFGGATCYSDGNMMDISHLERNFDAFAMEDQVMANANASSDSEETHEKLSLSGSIGPTHHHALDDSASDLQYSPTLACDFGDAQGSALDDVVMGNDDDMDADHEMSPLPYFGETDTALLDNLPELLQIPLPYGGPFDTRK